MSEIDIDHALQLSLERWADHINDVIMSDDVRWTKDDFENTVVLLLDAAEAILHLRTYRDAHESDNPKPEVIWQNSEVCGEEYGGIWQGYDGDDGNYFILYSALPEDKPQVCVRLPRFQARFTDSELIDRLKAMADLDVFNLSVNYKERAILLGAISALESRDTDDVDQESYELSALRERVRELEGVIQSYIKAQGECDEDSDNFHGEIDALIDSFKAMQRSVSEKRLLSTGREEG